MSNVQDPVLKTSDKVRSTWQQLRLPDRFSNAASITALAASGVAVAAIILESLPVLAVAGAAAAASGFLTLMSGKEGAASEGLDKAPKRRNPLTPADWPFGACTDYIVPRFTATALLAALDYRRRTGQGQYLDQSQAETALHVLGPALLDYTVNGRVQTRAGNTDAGFAPHGVYPAAGEDRWIAIACRDDNDWRNLCAAMGREDLAADARFASAADRLARREELDAIVAQWTSALDAHQAQEQLQDAVFPPIRCKTASRCLPTRNCAIAGISLSSNIPRSATSRLKRRARVLAARQAKSGAPPPRSARTMPTCSKRSWATARTVSRNSR